MKEKKSEKAEATDYDKNSTSFEIDDKKKDELYQKEETASEPISRRSEELKKPTEYIVVANRTYFHNNPDPSTRRKAFVVKGDRVEPLSISNGYAYIEFYSEYSKMTTKGWININDLQIIQ